MFLPLTNNYSDHCLKILETIGLTKILEIDNDKNVIKFESTILTVYRIVCGTRFLYDETRLSRGLDLISLKCMYQV